MHQPSLLLFLYLATLISQVVAAIKQTDFDQCLVKLTQLAPVDCANPNFICVPNQNISRPILSRQGCDSICGDSIDFDAWSDILDRYFLWILPVIVLAAHFQFACLGKKNTFAVSVAIFGNPIGSLHALLTRHEVFRRCYHQAFKAVVSSWREIEPQGFNLALAEEIARDIAAVVASCDEVGWNHPPIIQRLIARASRTATLPQQQAGLILGRTTPLPVVRTKLIARKPVANRNFKPLTTTAIEDSCSPGSVSASVEAQEIDIGNQGRRKEPLMTTSLSQDTTASASAAVRERFLDPHEIIYLAQARHDLVAHRNNTQLGTWFAIAGLLGSLIGSFIRQYENSSKPWSSRTIPMVILSFHLVALVQMSGSIGAFKSPLGPLIVLKNLQRKLELRDRAVSRQTEDSLFFTISTDHKEIWKRMSGAGSEEELIAVRIPPILDLTDEWHKEAGYLGMNPTWRPHKRITPYDSRDSRDFQALTLLAIALSFVSVSYLAALFNSFFAIGHYGFGCRSLMWSIIYALWILSLFLDYVFSLTHTTAGSYASLWHRTIRKDIVISFCILIIIIITHIGMTSTCKCKGSGTAFYRKENQVIDLWNLVGFQDKMRWVELSVTAGGGLALMAMLLGGVWFHTRDSRRLLCPGDEELKGMQLRLQDLKCKPTRRELT